MMDKTTLLEEWKILMELSLESQTECPQCGGQHGPMSRDEQEQRFSMYCIGARAAMNVRASGGTYEDIVDELETLNAQLPAEAIVDGLH